MIVTTKEAALELGVTPRRVQQLAQAGVLTPCRAGAKPLRFRLDDVLDHARSTDPRRDVLASLGARWLDMCAGMDFA